MASDNEQYYAKDAVGRTIKTATFMTTAGFVASAVQNTLTRRNIGAIGVLTQTGATIGAFGAMGGAFEFARTASANLREKDDSYNQAIGGFFGGSIMGLYRRSIPATLGYGIALATIIGVLDYTGGYLTGYNKDPNADEIDRKEYLRKNRRRPIEETVAELGEGRGIYGPGYAERRRERLIQKYGVDVGEAPSS